MRFVVKERLIVKKGQRGLVSKGYYVYDGKRAQAASPVYRTLKHADSHRDRLEEGSK